MPNLDTSVPHIARVYDYWLAGRTTSPLTGNSVTRP
jgi:hypothetical protein